MTTEAEPSPGWVTDAGTQQDRKTRPSVRAGTTPRGAGLGSTIHATEIRFLKARARFGRSCRGRALDVMEDSMLDLSSVPTSKE